MEENNWKMSNDNKNNGKSRFFRQFIVFVIAILLLTISVFLVLFTLNKEEENDNNVAQTNDKQNIVIKEEQKEPKEQEVQESKTPTVLEDLEDKVYTINDKDFYYDEQTESEEPDVKLFQYDNTEEKYAEIYYILDSYVTDPSFFYIIEAQNESGESLLLNNRDNSVSERDVVGGMISTIKIDKTKVDSEINITLKEMCEHSANSRTVERTAKITLNLKTDLTERKEIDHTSKVKEYELEGIKFEFPEGANVNKSNSTMYSKECKTSSYSLEVQAQYGDRIVPEDFIEIRCVDNINNLTLEEAFEIESKITENVGMYGLADKYKIFVSNGTGEVTDEYEITFEQMKVLADGKEVSTGGKRISTKDIKDKEEKIKLGENSKIRLANRIESIKYTYKNDTTRNYYMFIYNENIYYISVPTSEVCEEIVRNFLNSLEIK